MNNVAFLNHVQFANGKVFAIMTTNKPHCNFSVWAKHSSTDFAREIQAGVAFVHTSTQMPEAQATVMAYEINEAATKFGLGLAKMNTQKLNKYVAAKAILAA